jgi:hypothetical protein
MKIKIIAILLTTIYGVSFGQANTYKKAEIDSIISLFRNQTGIRALAYKDTILVHEAIKNQLSVSSKKQDKWVSVKIPKNAMIYGALPGSSPFFTTSKTLKEADSLLIKFWKSLQVESNQIYGYRPWVGEFRIKDTIKVAITMTQANPQFGKGGAWQIFVKEHEKNLVLMDTIKLRSSNKFAN